MTTEIRIIDENTREDKYPCEYCGTNESRCWKKGKSWTTVGGELIFCLCENHGQPLIDIFEQHSRNITITGGYDDEPKSKLVEIRERVGAGQIKDFGALLNVFREFLDHLIEKEDEA